MVKAFPNNNSGSTIMVPSPASSPVADIANRLQMVLNSNYDILINLIDNPPSNMSDSDWGGTRIQAGRIMVRLSSDKEGGNKCLATFIKKVEFPEKSIQQLISKAKKLARSDTSTDKNKYHNFYLIVSNVKEQQEIHIDTMTDNHQYGMPISNGVDSTIIYNVNKIPMNKQSTTVNNLVQMFLLPNYLPKDFYRVKIVWTKY